MHHTKKSEEWVGAGGGSPETLSDPLWPLPQGTIVVQAAGLTMAVFLGLTLFTFQTKIDFSFLVRNPRFVFHIPNPKTPTQETRGLSRPRPAFILTSTPGFLWRPSTRDFNSSSTSTGAR